MIKMDKDILYRFFDGSATDHEVGQVRAWVEASPENRRELFRERKLFDAMLLLADHNKHSIRQTQRRSIYRPQPKLAIRFRIPQLAAMLAVVFALGMIVHSRTGKEEQLKTAWYETTAPLGAKSQVILIDGTKVWLNAGSRLLYSTAFGNQNREVLLEGEAYFEVAKNATLPFDVKTSRLKVRAIGTAFNVKDYPGESTIETILVEGKVEVSQIEKTGTEPNEVVLLQPKQRLTLKKNTNEMFIETEVSEAKQIIPKTQETISVSKVPTVETTAGLMILTSWKDRRWRIESEELGSFAAKLERRFNVSIAFADDDLSKYKFNGTFEDEPLEEVLRALELAAPVKFTIKGNQVILSRNDKFKDAYQSLYELDNLNR